MINGVAFILRSRQWPNRYHWVFAVLLVAASRLQVPSRSLDRDRVEDGGWKDLEGKTKARLGRRLNQLIISAIGNSV